MYVYSYMVLVHLYPFIAERTPKKPLSATTARLIRAIDRARSASTRESVAAGLHQAESAIPQVDEARLSAAATTESSFLNRVCSVAAQHRATTSDLTQDFGLKWENEHFM